MPVALLGLGLFNLFALAVTAYWFIGYKIMDNARPSLDTTWPSPPLVA